MTNQAEIATLAGGCFWCVEAVFSRLKGVGKVISGYTGGETPNPTYQAVCSGSTGHAEAVQISFDPQLISFAELLELFWRYHDPTTLNRQGADYGTQYRSAIFYHDEEQRKVADSSRAGADRSGLWPDPLVTEIVPATTFYPAENYHQDYFRLNALQPYCQMVIVPKVRRLRKEFTARLKPESS
jgi:peptide-methionine (S)-S-oxide reductase